MKISPTTAARLAALRAKRAATPTPKVKFSAAACRTRLAERRAKQCALESKYPDTFAAARAVLVRIQEKILN